MVEVESVSKDATSVIIDGLTNTTTYYFAVIGENTYGTGDLDTAKAEAVTAKPLLPVDAPTAIDATGADTKVNLIWTEQDRAENYVVLRSDTLDGEYKEIARTPKGTPYYADSTVVNGKTYYYKVYALIEQVEGATTAVVNATPNASTNTLIGNLSIKDTANKDSWSVQNNFAKGSQLFGDAIAKATDIPDNYLGAEWIKAANNSRNYSFQVSKKTELLNFTVSADSEVCIAMDDRTVVSPEWLANSSFQNTGDVIKDSNGVTYTVYKKAFASGSTVSLGPNTEGGQLDCSNYFVLIKKPNSQSIVSNIGVYDLNMNKVDSLKASQSIIAKADISNKTNISKDATLVVALHDRDGSIKQLTLASIDATDAAAKTINAGFKLPDDIEGCTLEVFVWDSINNMKSISDKIVLH
jgi:hypothetical protein